MCTRSAGCHGNDGGVIVNNSYPTNNGKKFGSIKGSQQPQAATKDKKAHFDPEAYKCEGRDGSPCPRLPFSLLRLHKTQRAVSMVEMARCMCERPSFGVDPPRRLRSLALRRPSPNVQPRLFISTTSPRPSTVSARRDRSTKRGVFRPVYVAASRWVSRAFLVPKPGG